MVFGQEFFAANNLDNRGSGGEMLNANRFGLLRSEKVFLNQNIEDGLGRHAFIMSKAC
jgi:hypothetical protein